MLSSVRSPVVSGTTMVARRVVSRRVKTAWTSNKGVSTRSRPITAVRACGSNSQTIVGGQLTGTGEVDGPHGLPVVIHDDDRRLSDLSGQTQRRCLASHGDFMCAPEGAEHTLPRRDDGVAACASRGPREPVTAPF